MDSVVTFVQESLSWKVGSQLILLIIALYLLVKFFQLFSDPSYFYWADPVILNQSPAQKQQREAKLKEKFNHLPLYPNGWYPIICSKDLPPGQARTLHALGREWTVYRTKSGEPGIIWKKPLVDVVCPVHNYDFIEDAIKVPFQEDVLKSISPESLPPIIEVNNAVHVWFDTKGKTPQWKVTDVLEGKQEEFKFIGTASHQINAHIEEVHRKRVETGHLPRINWQTFLRVPVFFEQSDSNWKVNSFEKSKANFSAEQILKIGKWTVPRTKIIIEGEQIGPSLVHLRLMTYFGEILAHQMLAWNKYMQNSTFHMWASKKVPSFLVNLFMRALMWQYRKDIVGWHQNLTKSTSQEIENNEFVVQEKEWFQQFYFQGNKDLKEVNPFCKYCFLNNLDLHPSQKPADAANYKPMQVYDFLFRKNA